ncbi:MAG: fatty acid desaturase [Calditrichia bacterium]
MNAKKNTKEITIDELAASLLAFRKPEKWKAIWQLTNTFIPYLFLWVVMVMMVKKGAPYWATLIVTFLAAVLLIRIFIFFHDCCHGSFFASRKANRVVGYLTGILAFTSYRNWRSAHLQHHATYGNLDHRGAGDVWTLTVAEYYQLSRRMRLVYRLYRHPLIIFLIGPIYLFFVDQRFSPKNARKLIQRNVLFTNLGLLAILIAAWFTIGIKTYLLIQVPLMIMGGIFGIWLFYIQHQFDGVYWARDEEFDMVKAALQGSSYYKLPRILHWLTGNIGFHHVHHIDPRIPNYQLQACYRDIPALQQVEPLTISQSLRSLNLHLWDEKGRQLISFKTAAGLARQGHLTV